ncbi:hypothetical protein HAX54_015251, partial [Datura stramonium]|nr:hypothetical protein [Datura stramonium]
MSMIEVGIVQAYLCYCLHDVQARLEHGETQHAKGSGTLSNTRHCFVQTTRSQIPILLKPNSNLNRNKR